MSGPVAILAQGLFCSIPRGFVAGLTGGIRRAGGLLVRVGVLSVPPLILGGPWSTCLLVLFSPLALRCRLVTLTRGSGQENLLVTKLLNLGIPYLALYLLQLAGQAALGLRSGSLGAPLPGGPIRIHFLLERCVGVSCDRPASSRTWP
jgi:hypothetical protein